MRKRIHILTVTMFVILAPSLVFAGAMNGFGAAKAIAESDNMVTVPLVVTNQDNLAAMDIPLRFSDGVVLREVNFENTRVSYFDLKIANIDNQERTVVIGLLPQMSQESKPDLMAGSGVVANLVFEIVNPDVEEVTLSAHVTENPYHDLIFVYHEYDDAGNRGIRSVHRSTGAANELSQFESITVPIVAKPGLPDSYALNQNYPNPFNPSTVLTYALPEAAHVKLTVYNVLGQEVEVLADDAKEAGIHTVNWDAGYLASGVYFYRVETDKFSDTKKMMLLK